MSFLIDTNSCIDFIVLDIINLFEINGYEIYLSGEVYDELKKKKGSEICKNSYYSSYCNPSLLNGKIKDFLGKVKLNNKCWELTQDERKYLRKNIINKGVYKGFGKGDLDIICLFNKSKFSKVISRDMDLIKVLLEINGVFWYWPTCILMELEKEKLIDVPSEKYSILKGCMNLLDFDTFKEKHKENTYFIKRAEKFIKYFDEKTLNSCVFDF